MESSYFNHSQCNLYEVDLEDQAELCLQALFKAHQSAQSAVRLLDQETEIRSTKIISKYREDLEKLKFWTDYILQKYPCSSCTEST